MSFSIRQALATDTEWLKKLSGQKNKYYQGDDDSFYDSDLTHIIVDDKTGKRIGFYQMRPVIYVHSLHMDQDIPSYKRGSLFIALIKTLFDKFKSSGQTAIFKAKIPKQDKSKGRPIDEIGIHAVYSAVCKKINHRKFRVYTSDEL